MIQVDNLSKSYGAVKAVHGVSFCVGAGEIVGFLGPNGAGKSTVLKTISTWLPPDEGRVTVDGHDVALAPLAARQVLGYLAEHNALYDGMRVERFLAFVGRIRGLRGPRLAERMDWVVAKCSLDPVMGKRIQQCSMGYRRRVGLAAALIHDPRVILLDEPTHGLDPLQAAAFRNFVRELSEGRAILFSSHVISEVVALCGRVLVIQGGRLLTDTPLLELRARAAAAGQEVEAAVLDIVRAREGVA